MKKYGIYLAFPPTVDLRSEGLGRHLIEFLKGTQCRNDVQFIVACPSWMHDNFHELLANTDLKFDNFEFITPKRKPFILSLYLFLVRRPQIKKSRKTQNLFAIFRKKIGGILGFLEKRVISLRSISGLVLFLPILCLLSIILLIIYSLNCIRRKMIRVFNTLIFRVKNKFSIPFSIQDCLNKVQRLIVDPKEEIGIVRMFRLMMDSEVQCMLDMINNRKDILAWYSPTAFWPHFNKIVAPCLICVPDVVLKRFPVGFSFVGGQRFLHNFKEIEKTIEGGEYFTTYSADVKWDTLVKAYHISAEAIKIVKHGANRLDGELQLTGFMNNDLAINILCRTLFRQALSKAINHICADYYHDHEVEFVFYASQFRPQKNIITLLKAYEYLLRKKHIKCKLVLTGNPNVLPSIAQFIVEYNLENDVLCLHGLSIRELAACYRLAKLAINPSLSEGGFPFTFTEALSVDTPVVMARIPVTEEVLIDDELKKIMLFDPYDWQDMALRIEWALNNREALLAFQKPFYEELSKRTWRHVVDEYIDILDHISTIPKTQGVV